MSGQKCQKNIEKRNQSTRTSINFNFYSKKMNSLSSRRRIRHSSPSINMVCLEDPWMQQTRLLRYLKLFDACFKLSPWLLDSCLDRRFSEKLIAALASRSKHQDSYRVLRRLWEVGDGKRRNRRNIVLGLLLVLNYESDDGCWELVERVKERVYCCESAQKQAYILVIQQGAHAFEFQQIEPSSNVTQWKSLVPSINKVHANMLRAGDVGVVSPAGNHITSHLDVRIGATCTKALSSIHFMVGDYLDTHKEQAFIPALHEPARFYFDLCGNAHHRDHVNIHGINGWLCLIRGWFGCQIPIIPMPDDNNTFKGCADVWAGLSEEAWRVFCDPANLGKDFEGIKELNRGMLKDQRYGEYGAGHKFVGRNARDIEIGARRNAKKYLPYVKKFAFFFRKEFLVRRMFEVLNAEGKREYAGFRKSCHELYPLFREEFSLPDNSLLEFLYDEYMMRLDTDKAAFFFWWCGV